VRTLSSEVSELLEVEGAGSAHSWVRLTGGQCGSWVFVVMGGVGVWSDRDGVVEVGLGCLGGSQDSGMS